VSQARLVFRNTAVLAGARIIERTSGLLLALIITHHVGAAGFGIYSTALAYFTLIQWAGESGSTNLLIRELAKDRSRTSSYVVHTSVMALTLSGAVMTIAFIVIPHIGYGHDLRTSLMLIVLAVAPGTLNTIQEAVFVAHGRVEFETITTLVSSVILISASYVLIEGGHGVVSLVLVFVCLEYAVTLVYFGLINKYIARLSFEFRRSVALELFHEMKAFAGSSLVAAVAARPEIVILSLLGTEAQVGYYSGALKIVELFQFIPQVYMTNVFPLLARSFHANDGRLQQIQDKATRHLLAIALPISIGLLLTADRIIGALYGDDFDSAIVILRILAFNVVLYCVHAVLWRVLAARSEQGRVLRIQLVSTSARIGAGTALIATLRAVGAALSSPLYLVVHVGLLARAVRRDGTEISILRSNWRFGVASCGMGVAVFAMDRAVPIWFIVPSAAVVYAGFVLLLRALSSDEIALMKTLLPFRQLRAGGST
jgi:O-antigen/teichoic acid export membrane protein